MQHQNRRDEFHVKVSILQKIMLHVTVLVFVAVAICTYLAVRTEYKVLSGEMIHVGRHMTAHIASSAQSAFWSLNWIFVEKTLQGFNEWHPDEIIFAKVVKPSGEVYLANDKAYYGDMVDLSLLSDQETLLDNYFFPQTKEHGMLLIHPIVIGNERWYIILGLSLKSVRHAIGDLIFDNLLWGSLIVFLGIVASFIPARSISRPLQDLAKSAKIISDGNWGHDVSVKSKDEVGLLGHSFKRMVENLKAATGELKASEQRYRTLIETAAKAKIGIAVIQNYGERKGLIKYANHGMVDLFGYSRENLLKMTIKDVIHPDNFDEVWRMYTEKPSEGKGRGTHQFWGINKKGEKVPIEISTGVTEFDGRKALVCYATDITEKLEAEKQLKNYSQNLEKMVEENTAELKNAIRDLRNTQSQLLHSEKLASIGQLAAGIAHEINTPTQYVGDNTRFFQEAFSDLNQLLEKYDRLLQAVKEGTATHDLVQEVETAAEDVDLVYLSEEIPKAIEQTLEGVERVATIVRAMKEFSHPGTKEKTLVDINKAIETTIMVARNEWKYVAEMVTDFDQSLPSVPCLPGDFNQVILNMIINASHAIAGVVGNGSDGKGTITVSTHRNGDSAEIRISDTGTGIPEKIMSRIFDPFFTTKEVGKGTGQGLAIAYSVIVEKHAGTITFETEEGKGTTFSIHLPIEAESLSKGTAK